MFFNCSVHLLIYSSVLFIVKVSLSFPEDDFVRRSKRALGGQPLCRHSTTPVDSSYDFKPRNYSIKETTEAPRQKRFILFPEFVNYMDDYRYLQQAPEIFYWIANFYPEKLNQSYIEAAIVNIMKDINEVLDTTFTYQPATDVSLSNFWFHFFDYSKCPSADNVDAEIIQTNTPGESLMIYPLELVKKSRYRAHGGIVLSDNSTAISMVKLNMQQTFLVSDDYVYDPIIYTCDSDENNNCTIDLYYVMLHEILHGFGIEHTANERNSTPPNPQMKSVMHFSPVRVLCHDDIRAIRTVYKSKSNRDIAIHDDTCRRDFPLNFWQKLMRLLARWLVLEAILFAIISTVLFLLTVLYILLRKLIRRSSKEESTSPNAGKTRNVLPRGYLYHDEML